MATTQYQRSAMYGDFVGYIADNDVEEFRDFTDDKYNTMNEIAEKAFSLQSQLTREEFAKELAGLYGYMDDVYVYLPDGSFFEIEVN